jgi:hypothetical protein
MLCINWQTVTISLKTPRSPLSILKWVEIDDITKMHELVKSGASIRKKADSKRHRDINKESIGYKVFMQCN